MSESEEQLEGLGPVSYIQVDGNCRIVGVSTLSGAVEAPDMIQVDQCASDMIGMYYNQASDTIEGVSATVDKPVIDADGVDTATVTAMVPSMLNDITFYDNEGGIIKTVIPDPVTREAMLEVVAETPGTIQIRAGDFLLSEANKVEVVAQ